MGVAEKMDVMCVRPSMSVTLGQFWDRQNFNNDRKEAKKWFKKGSILAHFQFWDSKNFVSAAKEAKVDLKVIILTKESERPQIVHFCSNWRRNVS